MGEATLFMPSMSRNICKKNVNYILKNLWAASVSWNLSSSILLYPYWLFGGIETSLVCLCCLCCMIFAIPACYVVLAQTKSTTMYGLYKSSMATCQLQCILRLRGRCVYTGFDLSLQSTGFVWSSICFRWAPCIHSRSSQETEGKMVLAKEVGSLVMLLEWLAPRYTRTNYSLLMEMLYLLENVYFWVFYCWDVPVLRFRVHFLLVSRGYNFTNGSSICP